MYNERQVYSGVYVFKLYAHFYHNFLLRPYALNIFQNLVLYQQIVLVLLLFMDTSFEYK